MSDLNLPVLDLSLLDGDADDAARFRAALRAATHDVGFFYLTGTGIPPELEVRLHRTARAFFDLPEAGLLLILAVDHLLDMGRSATNVVGNSVAAAVVAKWEGELEDMPEEAAKA